MKYFQFFHITCLFSNNNPFYSLVRLVLSKQIIVLSLLFYALPVFCQSKTGQQNIVRLEKELKSAKHDTGKFRTCQLLAEAYVDSSFEKALNYQTIALEIARKTNDPGREIETLLNIGKYYIKKTSQFRKAIPLLSEGIDLSKDKSINSDLPELYLWQGISYFRLSVYDSARVSFDNSILINKKIRNTVVSQKTHTMLGNLSLEELKYKAALEHYLLALKIAEDLKDEWNICSSLSNIANFYLSIKNTDKALEYTLKCLDMVKKMKPNHQTAYAYHLLGKICCQQGKLDESITAYEYSIKVFEECGAFDYVAQLHIHIGNIFREKGDLQTAIKEFRKTIEVEKKIGSLSNTAYAYCNIGEIYYDLKQWNKSILYLDSALLLAEKENLQNVKMEIHKSFSELYADNKNYQKAYNHHQIYNTLKDSMNVIAQKEEARELEARYQTGRKEAEIRALNAENRAKDLRLYSIIGFSLLFVLFLYNRYRMSLKSRKKLEELDQIKSRFFANITHEFRTPLSLIMAPLQSQIEQTLDNAEKQKYSMMYRNAQRLNIMINQLLDLSKIETGNMELIIKECDVVSILKAYYSNFQSIAKMKKIDFSIETNNPSQAGFVDRDKLEKIIFNLLSNAFKFTSPGGKVIMNIEATTTQLTVQISDTGIGIPADKINHIFTRFYMVDDSFTRNTEGTGIGLSLSKEMTEIHKGKLTVSSIEGKGSIFALTLPIDKESFINDLARTSQEVIPEEKNKYQQHLNHLTLLPHPIINEKELPLILIVEDNEDMLAFLSQILNDSYRVTTATDGCQAWDKIQTIIPDIVISDIMMPCMDGNTLCEKIKTHMPTSHIPVIMLTAKTDQRSRIEGLQNGADMYLTKPFDSRELMVCIQNLLKQRTLLKKLFTDKTIFGNISLISHEANFLNTFIDLVRDNYTNTKFGVDYMMRELGMSYMQLHKKLKTLTGLTPGEYLRHYRLEVAKRLMLVKGALVGEVAYKAGFNNLSNFTLIFKEYTGYNPSEYINNHALKVEVN